MDNNMLNILKNLDAAKKGENVDGTPSLAASEKNAMKSLLETLDAGQRSVNQMPADHKMAKATTAKHPAKGYLVGGEEGEPDAGDEVVNEGPTPEYPDTAEGAIAYMREQSKGIDVSNAKAIPDPQHAGVWKVTNIEEFGKDWRQAVEAIVYLPGSRSAEQIGAGEFGDFEIGDIEESINEGGNLRTVKVTYSNGDSVTTDMAAGLSDEQIYDYFAVGKRFNLGNPATGGDNVQAVTDVEILEDKFGERTPSKDVHKKQSFADIFKSMEEADEEKEFNLEKEFYNKLQQEKELSKGDNGKFNLAEKDADTTGSPVKTRDARAKFLIKQARAKYAGKADDDLGAVVNMMTDKDRAHDTKLQGLDGYDHDQDSDINHNDRVNDRQEDTIADILDRLNKIEKK